MNFLSIDCCTDIASLFVKAKNKTFSKVLQSDKSNNDLLMGQILDFFDEIDLGFNDISEIFVNQGPGNFSGLRASLAVAKGISVSKDLKLFGYNTFIWSCARFFNKRDFIYSFIKFRNRYFVKKFDKKLKSNLKFKEITKEEITKKYNDKFTVIVKSNIHCLDEKIKKLNNSIIVDLDHNELEFLRLKGLLDKDLIKPLYLT